MPGMVRTWTWGEAGRSSQAAVTSRKRSRSAARLRTTCSTRLRTSASATGPRSEATDRPAACWSARALLAVQVRDLLQGGEMGRGDALGGGVLLEQPQHPAGGDVLGEGGQLGEGAGQEVVESVGGPGGLLDLALQAADDLAEQGHGRRRRRRGGGSLDEGEAGHGLALGVVGGALGEVRLPIILVALGLADGDGHGPVEAAEELLEIGGVLAGGVDADVEVDLGMPAAQLLQAFPQGLVAGAVLGDGERLGGRAGDRARGSETR